MKLYRERRETLIDNVKNKRNTYVEGMDGKPDIGALTSGWDGGDEYVFSCFHQQVFKLAPQHIQKIPTETKFPGNLYNPKSRREQSL